jgi:PPOX class probable F420-dependent enzyme
MPKPPVPPEFETFLAKPNPAVVATLEPDGAPHSAPTWYLWVDGHVEVNMAASRKRLDHLRRDPRVSLTVLSDEDWYRHVTISGRVVSIDDDPQLEGIDRLSRHYTGNAYANREEPRVQATIEIEAWHAWDHGRPWQPAADSARA